MANPTAPVGPKKTPSKRGRKRKVDAGDLTVFADREAQLYAERLINMETLARHPDLRSGKVVECLVAMATDPDHPRQLEAIKLAMNVIDGWKPPPKSIPGNKIEINFVGLELPKPIEGTVLEVGNDTD